jgi:alpha-1,6-mannosyltransferase
MLAQALAGRKRFLLFACGVALEGWALSAVLQSPGADIPRHVVLTLLAWAIWAGALWLGLRLPLAGWRRDLAVIFAIAIAMRVTLIFTTPTLSDDAYRAVWDARLVHAGVNPYQYAPAASETEPYRDDVIWPRVNHKEQRTPYPPLATLLSAGAYALLPERLVAIQALAALGDLASAAFLAWLLTRIGADPRRCLAIAWSPIGALHFAHSAHNDAIMIAALVAAPLLLTYGRRYTAFVALGLATGIKGLPALVVPAFVRAGGGAGLVFWAATCAILTLPLIGAGLGLVAGVLTEASGQRFNDSLYLVIERAVELVMPGQGAAAATAFAAVSIVMAVILSALWTDGSPRGALVAACRVLGVYILVAPVVEPWYFTWMAPLIALELRSKQSRAELMRSDAPAWIWLTGVATLTDLTYLDGGASLWPGLRAIEYLPAYALLVLALILRLRRHEERPEPLQAPAVRSFAEKRG